MARCKRVSLRVGGRRSEVGESVGGESVGRWIGESVVGAPRLFCGTGAGCAQAFSVLLRKRPSVGLEGTGDWWPGAGIGGVEEERWVFSSVQPGGWVHW